MNNHIFFHSDEKTVTFKEVKIINEDVYKFLKQIEESKRVEALETSIKIGVLGLKKMSIGEDMDFIEKEFSSMMSKINRMFDPEISTSHFGKIIFLLNDYFDRGGKIETILDPYNETTPTGKLKKEIIKEFRELKDLFLKEETEQRIMQKTTFKGFQFEDACEEILSDIICRNIGEELQRTTNSYGDKTNSLKGDFVITLPGRQQNRIVIETKDMESISQPKIIENIKESMNNRRAKYGILVIKHIESLPKKVGWFHEFHGDKLVVALGSKNDNTFLPEMLNIAIQWGKLKIQNGNNVEKNAIDSIINEISQISTELDRFFQIQTQCTNVEKSTKEIRDLSLKIKNNISEQIRKIKHAITTISKEGD
jgi:hypothetical protein